MLPSPHHRLLELLVLLVLLLLVDGLGGGRSRGGGVDGGDEGVAVEEAGASQGRHAAGAPYTEDVCAEVQAVPPAGMGGHGAKVSRPWHRQMSGLMLLLANQHDSLIARTDESIEDSSPRMQSRSLQHVPCA